jgi:hypothetical protein
VKSGEEMVEEAKDYVKGLPGLFKQQWADLEYAVRANGGSEASPDEALEEFLTDFDKAREYDAMWRETGEALTQGANLVRGVALGSDVLGIIGDKYTIAKPEDGGAMGWVDRGVAGVNAGASAVDGTYMVLGLLNVTTDEVPILGQVVLIGSGLYLGADYLYHHWTPFRDVANDISHATVVGAEDIGHAAVSGAKDAWHGITSIF